MSTKTTNYELIKPALTDAADITAMNQNWDKLDEKLKNALQGNLERSLPVANGGTGSTTKKDAFRNLAFLGQNPIASVEEDTIEKWDTIGSGFAWFSEPNRLNNQPSNYGLLINFVPNSYEVTQIWKTHSSGAMFIRSGNGNSWGQQWTKVYDAANKPTPEDIGLVSLEDLPNLYVWKKYNGDPTVIVETTKKDIVLGAHGHGRPFPDIPYSDSVELVDGIITLVNPTTLTDPTNTSAEILRGKYVKMDGCYYINSNATFTIKGTAIFSLVASSGKKLSTNDVIRYVSSKTNNTYPTNGEHTDGYWYKYHKQLGE